MVFPGDGGPEDHKVISVSASECGGERKRAVLLLEEAKRMSSWVRTNKTPKKLFPL